MSKAYREIWVKCPLEIITALQIPDSTVIVDSGISYLRFNVGEVGYTVIYNTFAESTVSGAFRGSINRPVLRQKKIELTVKESRYKLGLALKQIARLSDSSFLTQSNKQLVTIRDYVQPEYDDMVAAIAGNTNPFTVRIGYIPASTISLPTNINGCSENELLGAGEIKFCFIEANATL